MIYLIRVAYEKVTLLKVGYAKNIKKRMDQYTTENPLFELLDYREGNRELENLLHELFKDYKYEKGREWFYYNDFIVENFNCNNFEESNLIEKLKKKINNSSTFPMKLRLYCEFKEKYSKLDFTIDYFNYYLDILGIDKCRKLGYKEGLLYKEIYNLGYFEKLNNDDEKIISTFLLETFYEAAVFEDRMRLYCLFSDKFRDNKNIMDALHKRIKDPRYIDYYNYFGTEGCRLVEFDQELLKSNMSKRNMKKELDDNIYEYFKEGDSIITSETKLILENIYKSLGFKYKAKVSDLSEYFEMFPGKFKDSDGKFKNGFKLGRRLR